MTRGVAKLRVVGGAEPKAKKRKPAPPKREGYKDIAARILKGKPPAKRFIFTPTVKAEGDIVL